MDGYADCRKCNKSKRSGDRSRTSQTKKTSMKARNHDVFQKEVVCYVWSTKLVDLRVRVQKATWARS